MLNALRWFKENNPFYRDININMDRISQLPSAGPDGEGESVEARMVRGNFIPAQSGEAGEDCGPAPEEHVGGEEEEDVGAIIGAEAPGCAVEATMSAIRRNLDPNPPNFVRPLFDYSSPAEIIAARLAAEQGLDGNAGSIEASEAFRGGKRQHEFKWERGDVKVNEWVTGYWSMAFPVLFPYGLADISAGRADSKVKLADWAEHLLWYKDGRFAAHPYWKFVVMNRIMREQAKGQASFFVGRRLGASVPSVGELKRRVQNNDTSILRTCVAYAANVRGTNPYWYERHQELDALVKFMVWKGKGLPSFFMTGSMAEFHHMPMIKHLQEFLRQKHELAGEPVPDILNNRVLRKVMVKRYSHFVVRFFMEKTKIWIEEVLGPVYGVENYYVRFEFAKSRGQIHFHLLAWRHDRKPHGFVGNRCMEHGFDRHKWQSDLGDWFQQLGFTCEHPGGGDTEPMGHNPMWTAPEGPLNYSDGSSIVFPDTTAEGLVPILERDMHDYLGHVEHYADVCNLGMLHMCSCYCLKGQPCECRQGFGVKESMTEKPHSNGQQFYGGKREHNQFILSQDKRGYLTGEMPRNHRRIVQHLKGTPQVWGANCEQTVIISTSHPDFPDPTEAKQCCKYITGYMCKNGDKIGGTMELYKAVLGKRADVDEDLSCLCVCRQMVNASVGQMQISSPCASHYIAKEHLVECSMQFVRVPLGSSREINVRRRDNDVSGEGQDVPAVCTNIRDKFALAIQQYHGLRCYALDGSTVEIQNLSLYEWASGPRTQHPVGHRVPVPTGACLNASWPVNAAYAEAMVRLHTPGFVSGLLGADEGKTGDDWIQLFIDLLDSDKCPVIVRMDVHKQFERSQGRRQRHDRLNPYNSDDEESLADESDPENDHSDFIQAMRAGVGNSEVMSDGEGIQFDMGIDDGTDWSALHTNISGSKSDADGSWEWLKQCISQQGAHENACVGVTMSDLQGLKTNQRAAVTLVLGKMEEIHKCCGDIAKIRKIKPLRLIVAGTAGTGKTRVIKVINGLASMLFGNKAVQNVAPSGTAARCMGGRTIHSLFPIPFGGKRNKEMNCPGLKRLQGLQADLEGLSCLCVDERSMIGTVTFGWVEFCLRMGMYGGSSEEEAYGGLPILVMFGDDGQLPPIGEKRLFDFEKQGSQAGQNGALMYSQIDCCVYLDEVVRQEGDNCTSCSDRWHAPGAKCTILRDLLLRLRYGAVTPGDHLWLKERELHLLPQEEQAAFKGDDAVWIFAKKAGAHGRNMEKLEELNTRAGAVKVVYCRAKDKGKCMRKDWKKNEDWGQMPRVLYMCRGAMVMLTTNLSVKWGLFNGATGQVRDVYFRDGRQPSEDGVEHPDMVLVEFPDYTGPAWIPSQPQLVPLGPWLWAEHCKHQCQREQIPLRLCWGITVHKSQGMTVGPMMSMKRAVLNLGGHDVEGWSPGSAFVQLSRVVSPACMAIDGGYNEDRIQPRSGKQFAAKMVSQEDRRLQDMFRATQLKHPLCMLEPEYNRLVEWAMGIGDSVRSAP